IHNRENRGALEILIMKFVALTLALLFAGAQARFLWQADAPPSQLEQVRQALTLYAAQVHETAKKAIEQLEGTEFGQQYKLQLSQSLDSLQSYSKQASETLRPYGDVVSSTVLEATKTFRERLMADLEDLRKQVEPHREEVRKTLQAHLDQYREKLEPIFQEELKKGQERIEELKKKVEPVAEELREKVKANVEEMKTKLTPIVEAVRAKLTERLEELRKVAAPYAEEYRSKLGDAVSEVREKVGPMAQNLREKLEPYKEDLSAKLSALWETLAQSLKQTGGTCFPWRSSALGV
uniref:Apolipoprotein A-Ib n=2 Tax=Lepisosteus oculatus TaxID=7918 RepID=W5MGL6_LEPOC